MIVHRDKHVRASLEPWCAVFVEILDALSLSDRVEGEYDKAFFDQVQDDVLIGLRPETIRAMSATINDSGALPCRGCGRNRAAVTKNSGLDSKMNFSTR
jgi:citrate lyase gamma subunit